MSSKYFVYSLFDRGECVYIGFSSFLEDRVKSHKYNGLIFDRYDYVEFDSKESALKYEAAAILDIQPRYNGDNISGVTPIGKIVSDLSTRYFIINDLDVVQCAKEINQEIINYKGELMLVGSTAKLRKYMRGVKDDVSLFCKE